MRAHSHGRLQAEIQPGTLSKSHIIRISTVRFISRIEWIFQFQVATVKFATISRPPGFHPLAPGRIRPSVWYGMKACTCFVTIIDRTKRVFLVSYPRCVIPPPIFALFACSERVPPGFSALLLSCWFPVPRGRVPLIQSLITGHAGAIGRTLPAAALTAPIFRPAATGPETGLRGFPRRAPQHGENRPASAVWQKIGTERQLNPALVDMRWKSRSTMSAPIPPQRQRRQTIRKKARRLTASRKPLVRSR